MVGNEKAARPVKVFESTYEQITTHKGKKSAAVYIDEAVSFYIRAMNEGDPFTRIMKAVERIEERETTNLGLLCEVLRQAGILNGNGEVSFTKKD